MNKELLADFDMLLTIEKCIRGGMYHTMLPFAKANNDCQLF